MSVGFPPKVRLEPECKLSRKDRETWCYVLPFCYPDENVMITELQRENAVSQIVPINDNLAASEPSNEPDKSKGGDARRILSFA